jgi:hypothetical protein
MKKRCSHSRKEHARVVQMLKSQSQAELRSTPGFQEHEQLRIIVRKLATDFQPYKNLQRDVLVDCSSGLSLVLPISRSGGPRLGCVRKCAEPASRPPDVRTPGAVSNTRTILDVS